jgi:AcrR family transcriptional regulator
MQDNIDTHENFSERTSALAHALGIDVGDVAEHVGVSRATLFRYRSGKSPIPTKALRQLGMAEREAGIRSSIEVSLAAAKSVEESNAILRTASLSERLAAYGLGTMMWTLELQGAIYDTEINLSSFTGNSRELSRLVKQFVKESGRQDAQATALLGLSDKLDWQAKKIEPMLQEFFSALLEAAISVDRDKTQVESH